MVLDIKQSIKEKGLKHRWIAAKVDIHYTALSQYLSGLRPMPDEVKAKIIRLLE